MSRDTGSLDGLFGPEIPVDGPATLAENDALSRIGHRAARTNLARAERLASVLERAADAGFSEVDRGEALNLSHQISGSAGTFGNGAASKLALRVEQRLTGPGVLSPTELSTVRRGVTELLNRLRC